MDTIAHDIARKLLSRDFANLIQRVQRGGKLSRAERSMLQSMAASTSQAPTVAENYVELANILGVTRRSLQNWRKRKDAPKPASNGFHEVAAWREFMKRNDLEGASGVSETETALRARKLLAEVEDRELRLPSTINALSRCSRGACRKVKSRSISMSFKGRQPRMGFSKVPMVFSWCFWWAEAKAPACPGSSIPEKGQGVRRNVSRPLLRPLSLMFCLIRFKIAPPASSILPLPPCPVIGFSI
jgi:hypothetical protein